jgi:SAM-dependent methyltransferase
MQDWILKIVCLWGLCWGPMDLFAQAKEPRPYTCGFVLESEEAIRKVYGPELAALNIQPGQAIADVGGSNGYRMAMFAVLYDSLRLYVEDIDTACLNEREFEAVKGYYTHLNVAPLTSEFHLVVGTEQATNLPAATFDKVLVTASYHHFSDPEGMLKDLRSKVKPDGKIYVIENVVRKAGQRRRRLCNDPLQTEAGLQQDFEGQGFTVEGVHQLGRWWTLMFVLSPR